MDEIIYEELYDDFKQASSQELLEATIEHYRETIQWNRYERNGFLNGLRLGFKIAQEDGWRHVAPAWLREYRERKETKHD